jgi:Calcineurin-like phosphoesterase
MKKTITKTKKTTVQGSEPLRFAHPFFTPQPAAIRKPVPGVGAGLIDHIKGKLQPVPAPTRTPLMTLVDIIGTPGSQEIANSSSIRFHAMGDSGRGANSPQGDVAQAMQTDFDVSKPAASPAFLFHLGDVIYGPHKDQEYRPEFYEPYVHYPGKIIAIPGNHDGEVFPNTDPKTLNAFLSNFCACASPKLCAALM